MPRARGRSLVCRRDRRGGHRVEAHLVVLEAEAGRDLAGAEPAKSHRLVQGLGSAHPAGCLECQPAPAIGPGDVDAGVDQQAPDAPAALVGVHAEHAQMHLIGSDRFRPGRLDSIGQLQRSAAQDPVARHRHQDGGPRRAARDVSDACQVFSPLGRRGVGELDICERGHLPGGGVLVGANLAHFRNFLHTSTIRRQAPVARGSHAASHERIHRHRIPGSAGRAGRGLLPGAGVPAGRRELGGVSGRGGTGAPPGPGAPATGAAAGEAGAAAHPPAQAPHPHYHAPLMRKLIDGRLILTATDLSNFLACDHLTQLSHRAALGEDLPRSESEMTALLSEAGARHEDDTLRSLVQSGRSIKRFADDVSRSASTAAELERAAAETLQAMHDGWDVIYQPTFFHGGWVGRADFLFKVDVPSELGAHSYEVADAKLARHVRAEALLQLSEYSFQVARLQGRAPERMRVLLGDGSERSHLVSDFAAYHMSVRQQLLEAVHGARTYPLKVAHCKVCVYADLCESKRRADDHLSLVARMRRDQIHKLESVRVDTLTVLARLPEDVTVPRLAATTLETLRLQASLQLRGRDVAGGAPLVELLHEDTPGLGLAALPAPSPGDVFFDMEGDPLAREQPLEYLFGAVTVEAGESRYHSWLGHDTREEKAAFEGFMDWLMARLAPHPDMHVYHYAAYERSALLNLMGRDRSRAAEG